MPDKIYKIEVSKIAKKDLKSLPRKDLLKISILIEELATEPFPLDYKKLRGIENLDRVRQGNYRIIYTIEKNILTVVFLKVAHSSKVYQL